MQSSNLYVGNLSYSVKSEDLNELFSKYGKVKEVKIIGDRGFGFVEMETVEDAEKAIEALNETEVEGRTIKVNEAKPREDRGSRGGGGYQKRGYNQSRY
jgi:RNA recognition motif-containing protein